MEVYKKICPHCGVEFETTKKNKKFCCTYHTHIYYNNLRNTNSHLQLAEIKEKARINIPEVYPLEYNYKEFFLRDLLSVEDSAFISQVFKANTKEYLPLKDRKVKRIDGVSRNIPSTYCSTKDVYDLIQILHTNYKNSLNTNRKTTRNKTIKLFKEIIKGLK